MNRFLSGFIAFVVVPLFLAISPLGETMSQGKSLSETTAGFPWLSVVLGIFIVFGIVIVGAYAYSRWVEE